MDLTDLGIIDKVVAKRFNDELNKYTKKESMTIRKSSGLSDSQISDLIYGRSYSYSVMIRLSNALNKPMDYFLYGKKEIEEPEIDQIAIPFISNLLDDKNKIIINDEKCCYINKKLIQTKKVYCMRIEGQIMNPLLNENDIIIIDYGIKYIIDGKVFVFHNKKLPFIQIKRLYIYEDKIKIMPENNKFDPYLIDFSDIKIIGQVINVFKKLE